MRTDGRTDITKLIVAFRNFANGGQTLHFATGCTYAFRMVLTINSDGFLNVSYLDFIMHTECFL
jgi:hypothetical protein